MKKLVTLFAMLTLLAGCSSFPPPGARPAKIVIGVQSANPVETSASWQPLVADMGKKLGISMELVTASQTDTVKALGSGKADVVWLSSSAAIDAVADSKGEAFALYYNVNGTNGYKAVIATKASTSIQTLDEALTPGRYRFAAGARTSTSGYVLPQFFLFTPRKTTAEALFKSVITGGHFPNLEALWAGKVDVIVNNTTDLAVFKARTLGAKEGIITLWESPLVPNDVLVMRSDAPPATKKLLKDFFMAYGKTPEEKEWLKKASGILNFVPADNKLLEPVSAFKFDTERVQISVDAALTSEEKAQRLAELEQRVMRFKQSL